MGLPEESLTFHQASELVQSLKSEVQKAIFGQQELIEDSLCCLIAGGHLLMTGAPGLAKTTLVRVIATNIGLQFGRIQFTPDLLPSDILGSEILNIDQDTGRRQFEFAKGAIFTNLLLADEINRASPRTQSALLEAMQEKTVTVAGKAYVLEPPFMVFATQNPFESEGTFPLPEAQLDRFVLHTRVDYPDDEAESQLLKAHVAGELVGEKADGLKEQGSLINQSQLLSIIKKVKKLPIDDEIITGIRHLVKSTRPQDSLCPQEMRESVWYGAGPRAGISLISASRAYALMSNAESVRWEHVKRMAKPTLRHRIRLIAGARRDSITEDGFIETLLSLVEAQRHLKAQGIG